VRLNGTHRQFAHRLSSFVPLRAAHRSHRPVPIVVGSCLGTGASQQVTESGKFYWDHPGLRYNLQITEHGHDPEAISRRVLGVRLLILVESGNKPAACSLHQHSGGK